ncbi:MAG: hypothetical protein JXL80_06045 [Planctomycetes bacterium]|nr:hypothetical protein [Planctomycetota bacterium]
MSDDRLSETDSLVRLTNEVQVVLNLVGLGVLLAGVAVCVALVVLVGVRVVSDYGFALLWVPLLPRVVYAFLITPWSVDLSVDGLRVRFPLFVRRYSWRDVREVHYMRMGYKTSPWLFGRPRVRFTTDKGLSIVVPLDKHDVAALALCVGPRELGASGLHWADACATHEA